ncbi:MAG: amidase [Gemmataceae bacterium]|nr:amidase [Gemmataceae bacterium]
MHEPMTITAAADLIRREAISPTQLLNQCLGRIDRYEERVRAWAYLDREGALEQADRLTKELAAGQYRGPLHGIPIGVKDIIDVFDLPTGCGSKLWANSYARRDAACVARLRAAGAVILGKTVTTAYAYLDPPPTRNPWNLDRTPGGSSSGSAAAVACGMCLGALATQTGGSTVRPASYCGVFSLKPTHGRISTEGVLPLAPSLDHVGLMANSVRDLAVLFQAVAGYDPDRLMTSGAAVPDCLLAIDREVEALGRDYSRHRDGEYSRRFLRPAELYPDALHPEVVKFVEGVEYDLKTFPHAMNAAVKPVVLPPEFAQVHRRHLQVMAVEAAETHADRVRRRPDDYPPKIRELIADGLLVSRDEYRTASSLSHTLGYDLRMAFWPEPLLVPATTSPAPTPETTGDPWCNSPWSFLGLPVVSLPLGWSSDGLPLAIQLVGGDDREDYLLARAAWVEEVYRLSNALKPRPLPL